MIEIINKNMIVFMKPEKEKILDYLFQIREIKILSKNPEFQDSILEVIDEYICFSEKNEKLDFRVYPWVKKIMERYNN